MFRIKSVVGANDVAMHREVVRRRIRHTEWSLPDLMLIDGGKPQLNAVLTELKAAQNHLQTKICVAALAKREEELYIPGHHTSIRLDSLPSSVSFFFQHVRNESHRFAKKYHHKVREMRFRGSK